MTTFLQRTGRSGHALARTSRGRLFATSRDELVECAALARGIRGGRLDRVEPPEAPLDILAQQIVAECAVREWSEEALFAMVREATPFASLARADFDDVLTLVTEGAAPRLGRRGALVHRDKMSGVLRGRRAAAIVALTNGGAIPETADYRVVLDPDETVLGTVNEDWAIESMAGDVFVLGSHSWRIRRVESRAGTVRVEDAHGQPPTVPFWLGEAPSRSWELSGEVSRLRAEIAERADRGGQNTWLEEGCSVDPWGAEQLVRYVTAQRDALGIVPTMSDLVFERFFDEAGGMQLVVHAPFGARVNRAFGLALRKRFCVGFDFELQAAATDDAIVLSTGVMQSFPLSEAFGLVRAVHVHATLEQAVLAAPMFGVRWRWNASRALAVARRERGRKVPFFLQRMRADDLLAAVFPAQVACQENVTGPLEIPDHPLVRQTMRDCLTEAMDEVRLHDLLLRIDRGEIRLHARDTTEPSPFAHEVLNARPYAFLDDAPLEERRARAVSLRRTLPEHQRDLGALDAEAIRQVCADARQEPRDADELHDALLGLVAAPREDAWSPHLEALVGTGRAATVVVDGRLFAFAAENLRSVEVLYPGGEVYPALVLPAHLDLPPPSRENAVLALVRGHAEVAGPFSATGLAARLGIDVWEVDVAIARLESEGLVLRGQFTPRVANPGSPEACDRRMLARIHRLTLDRLRSEIAPVSAQDFLRYLFERHGLTAESRKGGRSGLRSAIGLLQGFEIAAMALERDVLAPRVAGYRGMWLDELCLAGEIAWARLTPRRSNRHAATSRATPVALALRTDIGWLLGAVRGAAEPEPPGSASATAIMDMLRARGALFVDDLARATGLPTSDLSDGLWDLVGRGLVASDGFQPLRELIAPRRRPGPPRTAQGRWSLVTRLEADASDADALADRVAGQLLARYGVVLREIAARESFAVPWRDVVRALRRREARGDVRGGRFVAGFLGEQYALPEAVDALRRVRRTPRAGVVVRIRAADPCNLVGIVTPGPRVAANQGQWLVFRDGELCPDEVEARAALA
jgi:ATP-dependent Lhr-like helicase